MYTAMWTPFRSHGKVLCLWWKWLENPSVLSTNLFHTHPKWISSAQASHDFNSKQKTTTNAPFNSNITLHSSVEETHQYHRLPRHRLQTHHHQMALGIPATRTFHVTSLLMVLSVTRLNAKQPVLRFKSITLVSTNAAWVTHVVPTSGRHHASPNVPHLSNQNTPAGMIIHAPKTRQDHFQVRLTVNWTATTHLLHFGTAMTQPGNVSLLRKDSLAKSIAILFAQLKSRRRTLSWTPWLSPDAIQSFNNNLFIYVFFFFFLVSSQNC